MQNKSTPAADAWTRYWQGGYKDTCFTGDQAFRLGEHWIAFFESLGHGAEVLDLATGNGAVALIADRVSADRQLGLVVHGVDQADVAPESEGDRDTCQFLGNTPIEALPYADGAFDALVSQFGFEYSDTERTVDEMVRVARVGARVRMIVHAADGAVHNSSRVRLRRARDLLGDGNLLGLARGVVRSASQADRLAKAESRFLKKARAVARKLDGVERDDTARNAVHFLGDLISRRAEVGVAEVATGVRHIEAELRAYIIRLNGMLGASQDAADMTQLCARFGSAGMAAADFRPVLSGGSQVAWELSATR